MDGASVLPPLAASPLCVHVGPSLEEDVAGASAASFLAMHIREDFDQGLPDWTEIDSEEDAEKGAERRKQILLW
jgi:hypothetical protein